MIWGVVGWGRGLCQNAPAPGSASYVEAIFNSPQIHKRAFILKIHRLLASKTRVDFFFNSDRNQINDVHEYWVNKTKHNTLYSDIFIFISSGM